VAGTATGSRWTRRVKLTIAGAAALAVTGAGVALGAGSDPAPERAPWAKRCTVQIKAYEDGSANLFCQHRRKPFGAVDADNGGIRFFIPR
jgi:hypothetical protein